MDFIKIILHDTSFTFALEIIFRCIIMFILIIIFLRFSGKRGVRQLSVFELAIILSLGSAAGDPMFNDDIPIIQALIVFAVIILLYRLTTYLIMKSDSFETMIVEDIKQEKYSYDEFFAELRQNKIEHLGQVKSALLETDGCLSVIPYAKDNIKWGLPIFPDHYQKAQRFDSKKYYSCMLCGQTQFISSLNAQCPRCKCDRWAESAFYCESSSNQPSD